MYHARRKIQQTYCVADDPGKINYNHPPPITKKEKKNVEKAL